MSCATGFPTFRLLDAYVGWDPGDQPYDSPEGLIGFDDPRGVRLAPIFGLEPACPHVKRGHIYARTITPSIEQPFSAVFAELNRLYHARPSEILDAELCH